MIDLTDDEAMAAEYVLGTLEADERTEAENRRGLDQGFDDLVRQWERRLSPLAEATPPLEPPADLILRLADRLPVEPAGAYVNDNVLMMRHKLRVWRGLTAAATALAAVLALWIVGREVLPGRSPAGPYVAVLQHGIDQPTFVVSLDLANRKITVRPLATGAPDGKSYELWMIGEGATPRSMGLVDARTLMRPQLPAVDTSVLSKATYAVTLEPQGGSPTGQPTTAPAFVGKLVDMSL